MSGSSTICSDATTRWWRIRPTRQSSARTTQALHVIDDAANDELVTIDEALQRLDRGLYGICKECGHAIEDVRLRALHAVTCSGCATD